jgi:hypothetical protein
MGRGLSNGVERKDATCHIFCTSHLKLIPRAVFPNYHAEWWPDLVVYQQQTVCTLESVEGKFFPWIRISVTLFKSFFFKRNSVRKAIFSHHSKYFREDHAIIHLQTCSWCSMQPTAELE